MKKLLFLLLLSPLFACNGDCFSCHPQLLENLDSNHKPMLSCKNCHLGGGVAACGADCFECHKIENISFEIVEHRVIESCRECHMKGLNIFQNRFSPVGNLRDILGI
jgi:hypothetical protein